MRTRAICLVVVLLAAAWVGGALADSGGMSFQGQYDAWNEHYKQALYGSGTGRMMLAREHITLAESAWRALMMYYYETPPAVFARDAHWKPDLAKMTGYQRIAQWEIARGDLRAAHENLEALRKVWREMRIRNRADTFADALISYHDIMEAVVSWGTGEEKGGVTPANIAAFGKEVERLDRSWQEVLAFPAKGGTPAEDTRLRSLLRAETQAIEALEAVVRARDYGKIPAAAKKLKQSFIAVYLEFG